MKNKRRKALFMELREEAKRINAWEVLELIQQAQTAFDCAEEAISDKTIKKQTSKIDRTVAKIRKILPKSSATEKLESERRLYQSLKDSPADDGSNFIDPGLCWCADDD